jgi:hypothetical protein
MFFQKGKNTLFLSSINGSNPIAKETQNTTFDFY